VEYRIGINDILRISVWRQPELTLESVIVRPDGRISVPLLNDVGASGKTPEQLKGEITERLEEYVREPNVTVVVLESRSRLIYVQGEVARKGAVPLAPGMRISDALAIAGGLGPFADAGEIRVLRERGSGYAEFEFDYNDFLDGEDLERNILLEPGDRIVVQEKSLF
jgi:polysaccharide export outer membrane protein